VRKEYDIVVIGGGHAGVEAAHAAARLGARTALVTLSADTIAQMSCNPAIGGIGKGQIAREIDALGGLMGRAADATGIQFRLLNRSKGPAVQGPRCQSDRHAYAAWVQQALAAQGGLTVLAGEATDILTDEGGVTGVRVLLPQGTAAGTRTAAACDAVDLRCRCAVVTAGTFLNGRMHMGTRTWPGGRYGEQAAVLLSASLRRCGLTLGRLKTGTCPRLAAQTIDYDACTRQDGDEQPVGFSFLTGPLAVQQVPCWLTATTPAVHELVRANLHRAPLYTGQIQSIGPRYCPSFETKVVRFADKPSHQVFLEPEGRHTHWVYCNGLSTSLPMDVQQEMLRLTPGLAKAEVLRWGYAIEYDFFPPTQLDASLQTKTTRGLFLAGQLNGTTGYEEAAAQGLIAGINAARQLSGDEPLILRRDQAYIGVMIDDLVTRGVDEPYRMFTSRAEYRLHLRADNADRRLTPIGRDVGLVDDPRWDAFSRKAQLVEAVLQLCDQVRLRDKPLRSWFQQPQARTRRLPAALEPPDRAAAETLLRRDGEAFATATTDLRYAGYLARQQRQLHRLGDLEARRIPPELDYAAVSHLRHEARQRLSRIRPRSLAQASRVSGITPADITVLAIHLARAAPSSPPTSPKT